MALRIPWDIEEAVLMLDMLLKSIDGKLTRKEAIRQVSEKLRRRAVNRGITIDDIFRNENGITFQMSALEVAYTGRKTKLKQPTKLFVETVNLYRNNRELYEEVLKEAENVVEPKSVQDEFCSYLSMQMPTFQLSDEYLMLSDIEKFCLERKILQNKLFETTDLETIKRVVRTVDSNRVFRFTYKRNLKKMSTVIHAYYTFLKSYKSDGEKKEVKPIIQGEISSSLDTDIMRQMNETVGRQAISVPAIERTKLTDLEERQKFNDWMLSSGMSKATITSYIPGNVNVSIRNASGEMLLHRLDLKSIAISTGSACDSVNSQISHVIQAIRVPEEYAYGTIRISFGRDNKESDAVEIAKAIVDILKTK